jgi:CubicO group peptidase (beta-lactamase class C family)
VAVKKTDTMNRFRIVFLLVFIFTPGIAQVKRVDYQEMLPIIDMWLDGQKDFDRLPGISVAIVQDQEILFSKGYGYADVEKKIPMSAETICSICSISKLFTAVAVMQLWEKGKLGLDDSLEVLLPEFKMKQRYAESVPITVRSLLTHSSGLPRELDHPYWMDVKFPSPEEINQKSETEQTLYPSSTYFQYSNLGASLLGQIVAKKSGLTYDAYVEDNILKPLQLANTHPWLPEKLWKGKMATGYGALHRDGSRDIAPLFRMNGYTPAAGFSSNVLDLAKFASWQMRLQSASAKEVLRPSTLKEMQRMQWVTPDKKLTWGLGFYIRDNRGTLLVGHDGSCPGYRALVLVDHKKKLAVSIMINAQGTDPYKYADAIFDLLNKNIPEDPTTKDVDMKVFSGRYDNYAWWGESIVMPYKGKLVVFGIPTDKPADNFTLFQYVGGDKFRRIRPDDDSLGEDMRFERNQSGQVTKFWWTGNYKNKID